MVVGGVFEVDDVSEGVVGGGEETNNDIGVGDFFCAGWQRERGERQETIGTEQKTCLCLPASGKARAKLRKAEHSR